MDSVNKTLYIPLYGKAFVSRKGIILKDTKAEEIWEKEGFSLKGKSKSKWLAYYMGMRSAVFDRWLIQKMEEFPEAAVLHLGCGMDSRIERVGLRGHRWYDVDFPEVIKQREAYFREQGDYRMLRADIRQDGWLAEIPGGSVIVILEGVSMYLKIEEMKHFLENLCAHFAQVCLLTDCYTLFAAKASRFKNPINDVGVTQVYGLDDPQILTGAGLSFVREHEITPRDLIGQLQGMERSIFQKVYAGKIAGKMYRLYEYRK